MTEQYIGLMSGTSLDGMDAVLVSFERNSIKLLASHSLPISDSLRQQISALCSCGDNEIERIATVDKALVQLSAQAVEELLELAEQRPSAIKAIGSHGQTIRHIPESGYTLQITDPSSIAEATGITVVADFRRRDMAAGGQGAPLVPAFHKAVFSSPGEARVIVNIGGISNISILPANPELSVTGFDTGPGNLLMDYWSQKHKGIPFDRGGNWAASAQPNPTLLSAMMSELFFHQPPPKSTGRELFNPNWLAAQLKPFPSISPEEVQATLCHLTASGIATAIKQYASESTSVFVCGGGAKNKTLMSYLRSELPNKNVSTTSELGLEPEWVEAAAFAWLAKQTLDGTPSNLPEVTGAKGLRILGGIYPA